MNVKQFQFIPLWPAIEIDLDVSICLFGQKDTPIEMGTPFLALADTSTPAFLKGKFAVCSLRDDRTVAVVGVDPGLVRTAAEQNLDEDCWLEWVTSVVKGLRHEDLHLLSDPYGPPLKAAMPMPDNNQRV